MFCPKCGNADQAPETYCRQCGLFLPDIDKAVKKEAPAEENIKVNTVLSMMTVITCFVLATLLYSILGFRPDTHPLIYATAGLLIAMGAWHIQTFIRARRLKKQWKRRSPEQETANLHLANSPVAARQLPEADFRNVVPSSVTEQTTKHLSKTKLKSS